MTAVASPKAPLPRVTEARQIREQNDKFRAKLLELAKECAECAGTGCVDIIHRSPISGRLHSMPDDCPGCLDIRELL